MATRNSVRIPVLLNYRSRQQERCHNYLRREGDSPVDVYLKLRTKLSDHFTPKKNKHHARYLFFENGATSAYAARLCEKAKECEFGTTFDERILEHIIQTIDNKKLIEKAISKTWDLARFLTEASQTEDIARQIRDMGSGQSNAEDISRVYAEQREPKQEHGDGLN